MFLFLSILFCLSISSAKGCPYGWVDASEYDLGKIASKKLRLILLSCSNRMPSFVQLESKPSTA